MNSYILYSVVSIGKLFERLKCAKKLPDVFAGGGGEGGVTEDCPGPALPGLTVQWGRQTHLQVVKTQRPEEGA